ncbi:MAG: outer membrane beta-barrel protein [Paludibacteraceae bacterium]|nr:outer membrane beta-barrel protein [Paludibacteraceae bacterium]
MRHTTQTLTLVLLTLFMLSTTTAHTEERPYLCEFGVQGGLSYYVGDAVPHIFMYPQYAAGAQFRYKFTPRWALQVKGQWQQIKFPAPDEQAMPVKGETATNRIINVDVVAEFNFFRFGQKQYDTRIKPITPYIFLGVGMGLYNDYSKVGAYLPFGFGMKWKFSPRWGLNIAWQHQLFFADNLENNELYNNYPNGYRMNGSNILKNDLTSTLTLGIVFEFAKQKAVCRRCQ